MLKKTQYRYWERPICKEASLDDLNQYGRGNDLTAIVDYSFVRSSDEEIATAEVIHQEEKNELAFDLVDAMFQTGDEEEHEA